MRALAAVLPPEASRLEQHRAARGDGGSGRLALLPGRLLLRHLCGGRPASAAALCRSAGARCGPPQGSTIGGPGLAISAGCRAPEAALAYVRLRRRSRNADRLSPSTMASPPASRPGRTIDIDRRFGGTLFGHARDASRRSGSGRATPAISAFQSAGGELVEQHLRGNLAEAELLDALEKAFAASNGGAVMKITDIEVTELRVPGWEGSTFDGSYDNCVVRVQTDEGLTGIAEVDSVPSVIRAIIEAKRSHTHAMGLKDGAARRAIPRRSRRYGTRCMTPRAITAGAARSSMPSARSTSRSGTCAARLRASRSICSGQIKRERLLAYGTVYPLGETPDAVRANIDRGLKLGLKAIKIVADPFWRDDLDLTAKLIRTAREHVGKEVRLMVDAATAWAKAEDGLPLMPLFKEHDFAWVEAPLPLDDLEGHARFQGFGVPIGGGDLGLTTCAEYRADVRDRQDRHRTAGRDHGRRHHRALRLAAHGEELGKRVVTHGYKSNITIAANLAFLVQHDDDEPCEYSTSQSPLRWDLTNESFAIGGDGRIAVPEGPGLGVSLNQETIARYRV